jgi:hypothetical protein
VLSDLLRNIDPGTLRYMSDELNHRAQAIHGQENAEPWERLFGCLSGLMTVAAIEQL